MLNNKKNKKTIIVNTKMLWLSVYLFLTTLSVLNLLIYFKSTPKVIYSKTNMLDTKINVWKSFLISHPDYLEGWIELTKLEISKGNKKDAVEDLSIIINLNPNSEEIINLQKDLKSIN